MESQDQPPETAHRWRRRVGTVVRLAITVGLLALLGWRVDWEQTLATFSALPIWAFLVAATGVVLLTCVGGVRWWLIARVTGPRLPLAAALRYFLITSFFTQAMPAPGTLGGDAVRIWLMGRDGYPVGASLRSTLVDRISALVGLVTLVAVTQPFAPGDVPNRATTPFFVLLLVGLVAGLFVGSRLGPALAAVPFAPVRALSTLSEDLRILLGRPIESLTAVGLAVVVWVVASGAVALLGTQMGLPASSWHYFVLCPPVFLAAALPISIAGWGVREAGMVVALGYAGVGAEQALAVGLAMGAAFVVGALPGGALWLVSR